MAHIVHCRICKKEIDIDSTHNWIMPSTNFYYHPKCYDDWVARKAERLVSAERSEEEWFDLLKDYLWKDIKLPNINWTKVTSQWKSFINKKFTPKGIYFAVLYGFEVQKNDREKAEGGIGLVPYIYYDSAEYWANIESRRKGTIEGIIRQIAQRQNRASIIVSNIARENKRVKYSLDDIKEGEENDG